MRFDELVACLRIVHDTVREGEKSNSYFLFAWLYKEELEQVKRDRGIKELVIAAGIRESFKTEISKGLKLAPYIELKPDVEAGLRAALEKEKR